jgi:hypothetical protein
VFLAYESVHKLQNDGDSIIFEPGPNWLTVVYVLEYGGTCYLFYVGVRDINDGRLV